MFCLFSSKKKVSLSQRDALALSLLFLSLFSLHLFFSRLSFAQPPPAKSTEVTKEALLSQSPRFFLTFSFTLWQDLLEEEIEPLLSASQKDSKAPEVILRIRHNLSSLQRIAESGYQHYLEKLQQTLPKQAQPLLFLSPLVNRNEAAINLFKELEESLLREEGIQARQKKAIRQLTLAPFSSPPPFSPSSISFAPDHLRLLLEAIEIFAIGNEILAYYLLPSLQGCHAAKQARRTKYLSFFKEKRKIFSLLQKNFPAQKRSLSLFSYHTALMLRFLSLEARLCNPLLPKTEKIKIETERKQRKQELSDSLSKVSPSFRTLWKAKK